MSNDSELLKTRHTFLDFFYWNLVLAVPFITACVAVARHSTVWLIAYVIFCILLTIVIFRFYCTHCPHYLHGSRKLKCMFFWGVPKYFESRPGPLHILDKLMTCLAVILIMLFPAYWLRLQPALLAVYVLAWVVAITTLRRYECHRCVYFECASNRVPEKLKRMDSTS